jgi:hypothetical protein
VVRRWPDGVGRQGANLPDQSLSGAGVQFPPKGGHRRAANPVANDAVEVGVAHFGLPENIGEIGSRPTLSKSPVASGAVFSEQPDSLVLLLNSGSQNNWRKPDDLCKDACDER